VTVPTLPGNAIPGHRDVVEHAVRKRQRAAQVGHSHVRVVTEAAVGASFSIPALFPMPVTMAVFRPHSLILERG